MATRYVVTAIVALMALNACTKFTPKDRSFPNYGNLAVGNYWIYEEYIGDTVGAEQPTGIRDSCFIEKDTLINGFTYYKMRRPSVFTPPFSTQFLRDSQDCIVNEKGNILFSSTNFTDVFRAYVLWGNSDTLALVSERMTDKNAIVTVPFGSFVTQNFQLVYHIYPPYQNAGEYRYRNTRYAENVGIVSETQPFYLGTPTHAEFRLLYWGHAQ
ncbi:MAG: hypothetical protein U0T73_07695 [Chitinophagales bacterium]